MFEVWSNQSGNFSSRITIHSNMTIDYRPIQNNLHAIITLFCFVWVALAGSSKIKQFAKQNSTTISAYK
jgi:hypothetical protein